MKQFSKGLVVGIISTILILGSISIYAADSVQIEVLMNQINIAVNGERVGNIGENYQLSNGEYVPNTLVYKGTTYMPLRKIAELLNKNVTWDGKTSTAGISDINQSDNESNQSNSSINLKDISNSRTNPLSMGDSVIVDCHDYLNGNYKIDISLKSIIRGNEAWALIQDANMFNDPPGDELEYMLATFEITLIQTENDAQIRISEYDFESVSAKGSVYDFDWAVSPEPSIEAELYQGGSTKGYVVLLVDVGDQPVIRYEYEYNKFVWFDIE